MKFLTKFSALALLATAVLGGMTACSDDDPDPKGQTGTLSIQIGETTYDSVTFTLSSSEQPAPTMYAYLPDAYSNLGTSDSILSDTRFNELMRNLKDSVNNGKVDLDNFL